jgi:phosphate-selective porin OprO/OprP
MSRKHSLAISALVGAGIAAAGSASAESASVSKQIDALQQQILQMQQQIQSLQAQVKESQDTAKQAQTQASQAVAQTTAVQAAPAAKTPHLTESSIHQFGIASADGANTIELTGRYMFDIGDYVNYQRDSKSTTPNDLSSGVNARRARLGVTGKFMNDWNYTFIYDFGGSSDTTNFLDTGAVTSGIENGFIEYAGLKPLYFDLGYLDAPYTLDESGSSNDIMFLERATPQVLAANVAAGDFRSAAGVHWNDDRTWLGVFATGPTSGAPHTLTVETLAPASSSTSTETCPVSTTTKGGKTSTVATCTINPVFNAPYNGSAEQFGAFGRAAFQILQADDYSLHVGVDLEGLPDPAHTSSGLRAISFSDRPELRIDPTSLVSTTITGVNGVGVYSGELAGNVGPFFVQGEYFKYDVSRDAGADLNFDGGYIEAAYTFTGESRKYNPATGAYLRIMPANPFGWSDGSITGAGAWEIAARYSMMDLNDQFGLTSTSKGTTTGAEGGYQQVYTAGLNWYPNSNVRVDLDYLHGTINKLGAVEDKTTSTYSLLPVGQTFDAVAARLQFVW